MSAERNEGVSEFRHVYFTAVGAPGSGKSSLVELLKKKTGIEVLEEGYQDVHHLIKFYTEDPWKHAFDTQMTFSAHRGLQMARAPESLLNHPVLADSTSRADAVMELALRKMGYISDEEHGIYLNLKRSKEKDLLELDIYFFLIASEKTIDERIRERGKQDRGRDMELKMLEKNSKYFVLLAQEFELWLPRLSLLRNVIIVNTDMFDLSRHRGRTGMIGYALDRARCLINIMNQKGYRGNDGARLIVPDFLS